MIGADEQGGQMLGFWSGSYQEFELVWVHDQLHACVVDNHFL